MLQTLDLRIELQIGLAFSFSLAQLLILVFVDTVNANALAEVCKDGSFFAVNNSLQISDCALQTFELFCSLTLRVSRLKIEAASAYFGRLGRQILDLLFGDVQLILDTTQAVSRSALSITQTQNLTYREH